MEEMHKHRDSPIIGLEHPLPRLSGLALGIQTLVVFVKPG